MTRFICAISILFVPSLLFSQKVRNVRTTIIKDKVTITYDLIETLPGDTLFISVFPSDLTIELPARGLKGDIGKVSGGNVEKKIEWTTKDIAILSPKTEISFDVRSELVYRFVVTTDIKSVRRGKSATIHWNAWPDRPINIQLVSDTTAQYTIVSGATKGQYIWRVPNDLVIDDNYRLRLRNLNQNQETKQFKIKHTIPTVVKLLPLAAAAILLIPKEAPKKSDLPAPPDVGLN